MVRSYSCLRMFRVISFAALPPNGESAELLAVLVYGFPLFLKSPFQLFLDISALLRGFLALVSLRGRILARLIPLDYFGRPGVTACPLESLLRGSFHVTSRFRGWTSPAPALSCSGRPQVSNDYTVRPRPLCAIRFFHFGPEVLRDAIQVFCPLRPPSLLEALPSRGPLSSWKKIPNCRPPALTFLATGILVATQFYSELYRPALDDDISGNISAGFSFARVRSCDALQLLCIFF